LLFFKKEWFETNCYKGLNVGFIVCEAVPISGKLCVFVRTFLSIFYNYLFNNGSWTYKRKNGTIMRIEYGIHL